MGAKNEIPTLKTCDMGLLFCLIAQTPGHKLLLDF